MLRLIDANSHVRRVVEKAYSGLVVRSFLAQVRPGDVYVWDGPNALAWRRSILPAYKATRKPAAENIYASLDLLKQCLGHTQAIQVTVPGFEADDVVATLARSTAPSDPILVETTDRDLKALEACPNIKVTAKPIEGVSFSDYRLFKTLVGDPSDNVKGIPGFGPKAWAEADKPSWYRLLTWISDPRRVDTMALDSLDIPDRWRTWVFDPDNLKHLAACWAVTDLLEVPLDEIERNMTMGTTHRQAVEDLLREYLQ